jgi:uncharacterized protein YihD (DUF1040 family)
MKNQFLQLFAKEWAKVKDLNLFQFLQEVPIYQTELPVK